MSLSKADTMKLVVSLPNGEQKSALLKHMLENGELTEADLAVMMVQDLESNIGKYATMFEDDALLRFLYERFKDHPRYLARALVQARPDVFYAYGFAFRLIFKLRGNLGTVFLRPTKPLEAPDPKTFIENLSDHVKQDILSLDRECHFRRYLYFMSRDPAIGFELLEERIKGAASAYDQNLLIQVRDYCQELLEMQFSEFVDTIGDSVFPAFHVRWWLNKVSTVSRSLNTGDTSTYKTAFSLLAMHQAGCKKILVLCAPHARTHWNTEPDKYYTQHDPKRVFLIRSKKDMSAAMDAEALITVVAYSTIIAPSVLDGLCKIPFDGFIWDESQYAKNAGIKKPAMRAASTERLIHRLAKHCKDRENKELKITTLSATPWDNHPDEFAIVASTLRPDIFPTAASFRNTRAHDPRFLRELFDDQIVEVEVDEVMDLPKVTPNPKIDLFGAVSLDPNADHKDVYEHLRKTDEKKLDPVQKVMQLLLCATHPHKLANTYAWPEKLVGLFRNWKLSTKLQWFKSRAEKEIAVGAKVVCATGIFASGITRKHDLDDDQEIWVGKMLIKWFGKNHVIILDASVSQSVDASGTSERSRLIDRWRSDPEARVLLVSMKTCPDSVNLSIPRLPGISKLFLTTLSFPWHPPVQWFGRFRRKELGVPIEYAVPVLEGTLDMQLLQMGKDKWLAQQLFKSLVALTPKELELLDKKVNVRRLAEESKSDAQRVNIINMQMRGLGEEGVQKVLDDVYGMYTNAEAFAKAFLAMQERMTSGHVMRYMLPVINRLIANGLVHGEGILDAGCGPLTVERATGLPVYGVDINPHIIRIAQAATPQHGGVNARHGVLSQLPKQWTNRFELVISSLVLDWTSARKKIAYGGKQLPERLAILSELCRVTHPTCGRVWLTTTESSFDQESLDAWKSELAKHGHTIIKELTGLVRATGAIGKPGEKVHPFAFWSLCFVPTGTRPFLVKDIDQFKFLFEKTRKKVKRGRHGNNNGDSGYDPNEHSNALYNAFEIVQADGTAEDVVAAAHNVTSSEVNRLAKTYVPKLAGWEFHRAPESLLETDWRVLKELQDRGVLKHVMERRSNGN